MALEFVLGRVRRDIRLNGSFMAHCCPTTSFRPMAGKAELFAYPIRQVSEWSGPLNVLRSSWGNGSSWPAVLGGVRAELQPLRITDFGKRRLTGLNDYSPYRPEAARGLCA